MALEERHPQFVVGNKVKFTEEGVRHWTGGTKTAMERCRKWRFMVMDLTARFDRWGNKLILLKRTDRVVDRVDAWSPTFFELATDEPER